MKNILRIAIIISGFMFTENCKTTANRPSNEAIFDKNLYLYERLSDEKVSSISNDITIRFFDQCMRPNISHRVHMFHGYAAYTKGLK